MKKKDEKQLKVNDNFDKQLTYKVLNKKMKNAQNTNDYECLLLYSYSLIEDRLLAMLYYLYLIEDRKDKMYPSDSVDRVIRPLLKFKENSKKTECYKIHNIATKIKLLQLVAMENNNKYLQDCKKIIEYNIGLDLYNNFFADLIEWLDVRNEIIHASFNQNMNDLNEKIKIALSEGYRLSNLAKKVTDKLKSNIDTLSVRDKWSTIDKTEKSIDYSSMSLLFDNIKVEDAEINRLYGLDIINPNISELDDLSVYDILGEYGTKTKNKTVSPSLDYIYNYVVNNEINIYSKVEDTICRFIKANIKKLSINKYVLSQIIVYKDFNNRLLLNKKYVKNTDRYFKCYINYLRSLIINNIVNANKCNKKFFEELNEIENIISGDQSFKRSFIHFYIKSLEFTINDIKYFKNEVEIPADKIDDKEVLLSAVRKDGNLLQYASERLKNDKEVVLTAVKKDGYAIQYASDRLLDDKEVVLNALLSDGGIIVLVSKELQNDIDIIKAALAKNVPLWEFTNIKICNNKEAVLLAVKRRPSDLYDASERLKNDKDVVLAAVSEYGNALHGASERLKDNKKIVLIALNNSGEALQYASERLKDNKKVVLEAVKQDGFAIQYASERLKKDKDIVLVSILEQMEHSFLCIKDLDENFKDDKKFMLQILKNNGDALEYVSERLKDDKKVVLTAVRAQGGVLEFASERLKNDKEVVLEAVKQQGYFAYGHASEELQNDKDVILAANKKLSEKRNYEYDELNY